MVYKRDKRNIALDKHIALLKIVKKYKDIVLTRVAKEVGVDIWTVKKYKNKYKGKLENFDGY